VKPGERRAALAGLLVLYAASRLVGLDVLPAFIDENWHIVWADSIAEGHRLLRPWQSGKWLSVVAMAQVLPWFDKSLVEAGRLLTAAFGALTLLATWGLARRLYDDGTALVAGVFYVLCPFTLFYDRLALTDPVMSTFAALTLLASVQLAQAGRARDGLLAGLALAATVLTKALGVMLSFVPAAAWLALARPLRRRIGALGLAYAVAAGLLAWPLWIFFGVSGAVRQAVGDSMGGPLEGLARNLWVVQDWVVGWWTLPLLLLALLGTAAAVARRQPSGLLLTAVWTVPLALLLPTATHWYPRYLLFMAVPTLILAARALMALAGWVAARLRPPSRLWRLSLPAVATALALIPSLQIDADLWTQPSRAPLPTIERVQFIDGWPSGYGVRETVAFLTAELERRPEGITVVMNSGSRPTTRLALNVASRREPRLHRRDLPLQDRGVVPLLERWARERPTFLVVSQMKGGLARPTPQAWGHLVVGRALETRKPDGGLCDQIYRLAEPSALRGGEEERSSSQR
jgi:hypothetical protein